jgi:Domain of unknown function (DU1801)
MAESGKQQVKKQTPKKKARKQKPKPAEKAGKSPVRQLDEFLDKFTPEVAAVARQCLDKMRARLPGATQLVYDNYNALAIGFGPSERASEAIFSIVLYPKYVTFFFLQGSRLPDPKKVLQGRGKIVRHIRLESAADLDQPAVRELMVAALQSAKRTIDPNARGGLVVRAVAAKQRPRRPDQ